MWLALAFCSAFLLGLYDVSKKHSLRGNAVLPVLFINTLVASMIFAPLIIGSYLNLPLLNDSVWYVQPYEWSAHRLIILKAFIVLSSWLFGYFAMKHLPITIVGPINATRPVMVLVGAMLVFGERLNLYQWIGVTLAITSIFLLSIAGKREGIDFKKNKWVLFLFLAAVMGAISGLYDKFVIQHVEPITVQSWYNVYQVLIMCPVLALLWYPQRKKSTAFQWRWSILLIPVLLSLADLAYFFALSYDEAMISIVSMIRRSSVVVSFACGAFIFGEKNLKAKVIDLVLIIIGMIFLYLGSR